MWLYVPTLSVSAPAAAASISESNWQCQALAQSLWWRGKPSPSATWSKRLEKVSWLKRLSGRMCEPSTAAHGAVLWMASLAESRASPIPSRESVSERKTSGISGAPRAASSSKPGPGSSSSKTSKACSPAAAPSVYGETFADLVTNLRSDYSARQKRAQAISATGSLSSQWPTVTAGSAEKGPDRCRRDTGSPNSDLPTFLANWPTPDANVINDGEEPETFRARQELQKAKGINGNGMGTPLAMAAKIWSTPRSSDGEKGGPNQSFGAGGIPLASQVSQWRTPTANDSRRGVPEEITTKEGQHSLNRQADQWTTPRVSETGQYQYNKGNPDDRVLTLQGQAQTWSTPSIADTTGGRMTRSGDRSNELLLKGQAATLASSLPDHPISTVGEESSKIRRTLNPLFVEWLMGWPPGWTSLALTPPASNDCACSATELYRYKQHMRSELLRIGLPQAAPPAQLGLFT